MSGATILNQLATLSRDLDNAIRDLARLSDMAAEAEGRYRSAKAKALLASKGKTAGERDAAAALACENELLEREKTKALVEVQRAHIKALHTRIDVGRTIAATDRAMSGVGI